MVPKIVSEQDATKLAANYNSSQPPEFFGNKIHSEMTIG